MSTGVCVINRNGIALAADSAGTYTSGTGNVMFYNSMDKVFSLSESNKCGAIIYGNMSFYNVSVDQVLREFKLYVDEHKQVEDFFDIWDYFQKYIEEQYCYYKFDEAEKEYCQWFISTLINDWGNRIKDIILEENASEKIKLILGDLRKHIDICVKVEGFEIEKYIQAEYFEFYKQEIERTVPQLKGYETFYHEFWELLCDYFNLWIESESKKKVGILFAGYGTKDAFPKCLWIDIHKIFKSKIKYKEKKRFTGDGKNAEIIPIAQREEIMTFCRGISSKFIDSIPETAKNLIENQIDSLSASEFSDEQKHKLKLELVKCSKNLSDKIMEEVQNDNIQPIIDSVKLIALPEMAFLAENLIDITALKRTYALDGNQQTVGGPTDVAVISKASGFVWIKQK